MGERGWTESEFSGPWSSVNYGPTWSINTLRQQAPALMINILTYQSVLYGF